MKLYPIKPLQGITVEDAVEPRGDLGRPME
jgi:hypothetical protein